MGVTLDVIFVSAIVDWYFGIILLLYTSKTLSSNLFFITQHKNLKIRGIITNITSRIGTIISTTLICLRSIVEQIICISSFESASLRLFLSTD